MKTFSVLFLSLWLFIPIGTMVNGCAKTKGDKESIGKLSLHEISSIEITRSAEPSCGDSQNFRISNTEISERYSPGDCKASAYEKKYLITAAQHKSLAAKIEAIHVIASDGLPTCDADTELLDGITLIGKAGTKAYKASGCSGSGELVNEADFKKVLEAVFSITTSASSP